MKRITIVQFLMVMPGIAFCICPHEDPQLAKWSNNETWQTGLVPGPDHLVVVDKPILLNGISERLKSVKIMNGGKLVFDPTVDLAKLTSDQILIEDGGEMHIGSPDCKFEGKAEILLTGVKDDDSEEDPLFGRKFLGVKAGGTLDIHGRDKKSWTKLAKTVTPHEVLFQVGDNNQPKRGIIIYEFDRNTGKLLRQSKKLRRIKHVKQELGKLLPSSVVIMLPSSRKQPLFNNLNKFVDILEGPLFLNSNAKVDLRNQWTNALDSWVYIFDRSANGKVSIYSEFAKKENNDQTTTKQLKVNINGNLFRITNTVVGPDSDSKDRVDLKAVKADNFDIHELELVDNDLSTWLPGDRLVIASTDYDFNQAEEVEIVSVQGNKVTVKGELIYTHFGEIFETIDMRAEVGLLTRNVLIHGEMGTECSDDLTDVCDKIDFDMYGGHTKAVRGFKKYNIEGAELTHMGQMTVSGAYPIHFHLCHNASTNGIHPIVKSNSIHHCFSRCVTIHGTHEVHVKDNVAHDTYGHCYFLEDGGEKNNVFDGNLGLTTRKGYLTKSDTEPTTFWFTSPLVKSVNNVAAGSDRNGVGFWYLFPDEPLPPSKEFGFFARKEAKFTKINMFNNNVAHSNGKIGLAVFRRLGEDHEIKGCSTYDPKVNPKDRRSARVPAQFSQFTGYKNRRSNVIMRVTTSELTNFKLAESITGITFVRNMLDGYQRMKDSLIVGETPNKGVPQKYKVRENGKKVWKMSDRSLPLSNPSKYNIKGVYIDSEGPLHLHNVEFKNFPTNQINVACAIEFKDKFRFGMGPSSSVRGLKFNFNEPDALRICHKNVIDGPNEASMILKDLDGSLTGQVGTNVVSTEPYVQYGISCTNNTLWNMSLCDGSFARFYMFPKQSEVGTTFITKGGEVIGTDRLTKVSYTVNTNITVVMSFFEASPEKYKIAVTGVRKASPVTIGFCLPLGSEVFELGRFVDLSNTDRRKDHSDIVQASSFDELVKDLNGKNTYLDKKKGILYVKFIEKQELAGEDLSDCPDMTTRQCPFVSLDFRKLTNINLNNADCLKR